MIGIKQTNENERGMEDQARARTEHKIITGEPISVISIFKTRVA